MSESRRNEAKYQVTVETAKGYFGAGGKTNRVHIELTGEDGRKTGWIDLNKSSNLKSEFRAGKVDVFKIKSIDVGLPVIIRLGVRDHMGKDPWAVRHVNIKYKDEETHFPVHDWIKDELWITRGEGLVYHKVSNPFVTSMLDQEVEKSRALLQWVPRPGAGDLGRGLPRFVNSETVHDLPLIFRPTEVWKAGWDIKYVEVGMKKFIEVGTGKFLKKCLGKSAEFDSLEKYKVFFEFFEKGGVPRSSFLDRWKSDEEFGRQQLNGISPTAFERCTKIPEVCQISNDHVAELLDGKSLEEAMQAGKVYIADYSEVYKGVKRNKNTLGEELICPEAICLYYVNSSDDFVPVAIQLVPNDPQTIFTPKNSEEDWLLAKMYFKVAFGNLHEWYYHFVLTHGVMESFAVALFRGLPRSHPIYKLLRPHLQTIPVINSEARLKLIAAGSLANKALATEGEDLARHTFKTFTMDDILIPEVLKKRGLDDEKLLPKYYYRDDALQLWDIMKDFVSDIIKIYYDNDSDVRNDKHLQEFIKDVAEEGLGWEDGTTRSIPVPTTSIEQLIRMCTSIIHTSSVQHSAVNFPQYEMYKFIPNSPTAMRLPPHKQGEANLKRMLHSLPDLEMSVTWISVATMLSRYADAEVYLGNYPVKLFVEEEPQKAIEKYQKAIEEYGDKVKKRNENVKYPYIWLLPEKIPNSIAI